jgi:hypothetical protein
MKVSTATAVVVVVAGTIIGGALVHAHRDDASAAGGPAVPGSLGVFDQAQRPGDRLPGLSRDAGTSRLAYAGDGFTVYAVTRHTGDVCLVARTSGGTTSGCASLADAASERPLVMSTSEGGRPLAVGLLHDGPTRVHVRSAERSWWLPVRGNVFVVRGAASSVSWTSADGSRHAHALAGSDGGVAPAGS